MSIRCHHPVLLGSFVLIIGKIQSTSYDMNKQCVWRNATQLEEKPAGSFHIVDMSALLLSQLGSEKVMSGRYDEKKYIKLYISCVDYW